jgi:CDP-paratose 2-epimerase
MRIALVTGSGGLIGGESVDLLCSQGYHVIGVDNDMRSYFFGKNSSTKWNTSRLINKFPKKFKQHNIDIRDYKKLKNLFVKNRFELIIHTAAQPSHDWAAKEPLVDFSINANGTLNLLELTRKFCSDASFIYTSTNKVYGDTPNTLPLEELDNRFELTRDHVYWDGIDENMSIDMSTHSVFGASKASADLMTQEYARYFGLNTAVFRGGCLTGPTHSSAELHGFLGYLVKCITSDLPYTIQGYRGKQVRDNIHAQDLIQMFLEFHNNPRKNAIYNAGGGRANSVSILEAIEKIELISGKKASINFSNNNRVGDHIWYISNLSKFKTHYPKWSMKYSLDDLLLEMVKAAMDKD